MLTFKYQKLDKKALVKTHKRIQRGLFLLKLIVIRLPQRYALTSTDIGQIALGILTSYSMCAILRS